MSQSIVEESQGRDCGRGHGRTLFTDPSLLASPASFGVAPRTTSLGGGSTHGEPGPPSVVISTENAAEASLIGTFSQLRFLLPATLQLMTS